MPCIVISFSSHQRYCLRMRKLPFATTTGQIRMAPSSTPWEYISAIPNGHAMTALGSARRTSFCNRRTATTPQPCFRFGILGCPAATRVHGDRHRYSGEIQGPQPRQAIPNGRFSLRAVDLVYSKDDDRATAGRCGTGPADGAPGPGRCDLRACFRIQKARQCAQD